jgi:hypothetical protein
LWRAGCPDNGHGRFGGRVRETDQAKTCHRALARSYGQALAFQLRPGNAGSNTACDHIAVLEQALAQIPSRHRRDVLVTVDGAGATLELIRHITALNTAPGRRVHYSVGFDVDERARTAIHHVPEGRLAGGVGHRRDAS